jgi:hypothetical protein
VILGLETWLAIAQINAKSYERFIPGMGTTYLPGAYYRHTKEGFSEGYINHQGFRDYERTYNKPAHSFRILVLGDSYVEALQVALQDSFPALLEKSLNQVSTSIKFEVLNLGQSGFGTADEYMRYLNFGVKYSPDLVLLAFLTGNDIQDNSKFLSRDNLAFYFTFDGGGNLKLDRSLFDQYERNLTLAKRAFQYIKQKPYLASLISERLYLLKLEFDSRHFHSNPGWYQQSGHRQRLDEFSPLNIYLPVPSEPWKEAFDITTNLIRKFRDSVEVNGSRFLLVTLSNAEQVHPEVQQQLKDNYGVTFDFEQPDRIIERFARKEHITHLMLMPAFRDYHLRTGKYLHGFGGSKGGHWNENGHRLAAEKIFEFLKEKHLVPLDSAQQRYEH